MYFNQAPGPIAPHRNSGHSRVSAVQLGSQDRVADTLGNIDMDTVSLIDRIPYYSNGGAMNTGRSEFLKALPFVNYQTLRDICIRLLAKPDEYWKDERNRNFSGIGEAIEARFEALGYRVTETQERHYLGSETMKRIHIPVSVNKK